MQKSTIQLAKEHAIYLDNQFHKNYPQGKFALQRINASDYRLHWSLHRSTRKSFIGITVRSLEGKLIECNEHITSVGKWNYYSELTLMLEAAKRFGFSQESVDKFLEGHKNWKE
jgi:hypothetical protein